MNGIIVKSENGQPQLVWTEVPDVAMSDDQVLVNIRATAVNRADLMQATGNYPPASGESEILGLEMAGEIAAVGANVTGWEIGDRVCALLAVVAMLSKRWLIRKCLSAYRMLGHSQWLPLCLRCGSPHS